MHDAIVVGSGPNGLAAAIVLARAGRSVLVVEGRDTIGGGLRTEKLTLPGFLHDTCSAIHPLGVASPFLQSVPLTEHGVDWVDSPAPLAHPLDDGTAVLLRRSVEETAAGLGADGRAWRRLFDPLVEHADAVVEGVLAGPRPPRRPLVMGNFGRHALRSAASLAQSRFAGERARALFAGNAAHAMLPLDAAATASFGLVLALLGHAAGWPFPRGGSQAIANALASSLRSLGGEIETGRWIESLEELRPHGRPAPLVLLDVTPRQLVALAGDRLGGRYRRALERYRYGPGVVKVDYALSAAVPWRAADCALAATVHLGGTLAEIRAAEAEVARGGHPERPYVLVAQQSLFEPSRAPEGRHTLWAYTHVPNGSTLTARTVRALEGQLERFAPGFRDVVLERSVLAPADLEARNPNDVGGDINGGSADLRQLFARPVARWTPWRTPLDGVFLCSSSTPPGGGVHGMCGYHAARAALSG
ncbi:NAD(P)/FAD-dependent oxidoreductase [Gaiella sp.]|uniref:phytoene desaturase family protein n=1 Tax=Gaiella sp. TaxID=2663207 RepID=UPI002E369A11|nr:NAD(P)/FAD-dependent oxidoreductase [Gaiella sp.]HEX5585225.1 NAD(P)/FAD-dependent oxidoreductase [Gaiella sp.]